MPATCEPRLTSVSAAPPLLATRPACGPASFPLDQWPSPVTNTSLPLGHADGRAHSLSPLTWEGAVCGGAWSASPTAYC